MRETGQNCDVLSMRCLLTQLGEAKSAANNNIDRNAYSGDIANARLRYQSRVNPSSLRGLLDGGRILPRIEVARWNTSTRFVEKRRSRAMTNSPLHLAPVQSSGTNLFSGWQRKRESQGRSGKESCVKKYGWSLRLKQKSRNIVYLGPGEGCFMVSFVLSDKALKAAKVSHLPKAVADALDAAPRYPEGNGLRLLVHRARRSCADPQNRGDKAPQLSSLLGSRKSRIDTE